MQSKAGAECALVTSRRQKEAEGREHTDWHELTGAERSVGKAEVDSTRIGMNTCTTP